MTIYCIYEVFSVTMTEELVVGMGGGRKEGKNSCEGDGVVVENEVKEENYIHW